MVLPTTYWGTQGWWQAEQAIRAAGHEPLIEVQETFPKQTCRNRTTILSPAGEPIVLSVPVQKVEHKQLTRDIEISNQQRWQHQHWNAILSAYKKTPYFDYYADFIRPLYEREWRFLLDLNQATYELTRALLQREMPGHPYPLRYTDDWSAQELEGVWSNEISVLDQLFKV